MRTFRCACGARVFFDNSRCLACGRELGFVLDSQTMLMNWKPVLLII
jgi:hypothetical protein